MSVKHPIIVVTGSSGAGTSTVKNTFDQIFRREGVHAAHIEGDAFHAYGRVAMGEAVVKAAAEGNDHFSHFSAEANLLAELSEVFAEYSEHGTGKTRHYVHDEIEARAFDRPPGTFTDWSPLDPTSDILFYEGLHGAAQTDTVNLAQYGDLKIGVVPVINLEWIQKLHRDQNDRGHTPESITAAILRRMPDYVKTIVPQFTYTDINFQRVPLVDTSNPFISRTIPTADESMVVIRFRNPAGIDFGYLVSMMQGSFMSRANSIVVPGGKLDLAMQLILTPLIKRIIENKKRAG
ncbi:phosphoribulokinase [Propionicimonas sp.]|uniref:phosphoribulokinase n=1 Tax=Propionicimonas sp. TaxID=1955623 RepID=UPI0018170BD3|nr:phosphoribulokinase [Propionicimonas sp.]MBU3976679.1 phosphoribulokinase [Actinomycetota bacterium]MBA3019745.1 phosphoribulokinase [Propionicimonas sp.]MBU3986774.1 phosphoribulokinase [Actinomycetota bacterium]MBU4006686.1 phosphoribulokinase [Actinomycetota bacterium]MBU4065386.1 phosphoribulokinase [Actinomycetota bacterium]